jgi:proteasome lid subunit RPN8/RPN11
LRRSGHREIGGILMGKQIAPGHFRIVDFSVERESGSPVHLVRSPEHHHSALEEFFQRTGADYCRFNYLGEWHSHPSFPVRPSPEDVQSMTDLVQGESDITFAALLIVSASYVPPLGARLLHVARHHAQQEVALNDELSRF